MAGSVMQDVLTIGPTAVLMARIADETGALIRACDIAAIRYSLFELGADGLPRRVAGDVSLDVDAVVTDSAQIGGTWTLDTCGYNFRHEIELSPGSPTSRSSAWLVVYVVTPITGPPTIFRFRIKGTRI